MLAPGVAHGSPRGRALLAGLGDADRHHRLHPPPIVWQRSLFAIYGINIEAVTVVVTAFMVGLGGGSLAGGAVSRDPGRPALALFGAVELAIGAFGVGSLRLFRRVGRARSLFPSRPRRRSSSEIRRAPAMV